MECVIGSGPAGVACASALINAGAKVTMLDAGLQLEGDRQRRLDSLKSSPPNRGDAAGLSFIREGVRVEQGGIPLKLAYGSDFPYREPISLPIAHSRAEGKPSYALGGLSNVWGASIMPFRAGDMSEWPVTTRDLARHYEAVLDLLPLSARRDRLEECFPLYSPRPGSLSLSVQATALLADLERHHEQLAKHGITFGASRLALQGQAANQPGCVYCAQCMYGCPYGFIYNSAATVERLRSSGDLTYRPGILIERLVEHSDRVEVRGRHLADGSEFNITADRVFVACGVFSTTRLMLESLEAYGETLRAVDNCYFLLPLLRFKAEKAASSEPRHTLAQAFIELLDPEVSSNTVHLQVYAYNELFREQVRNMLGPADAVFGRPVDRLVLSRLLLIQGYLHSDISPAIDISLRRGANGQPATLSLAAMENPRTRSTLSALIKKLWAERSSLSAVALSPALRVGKPGRGFHSGGTFPMRSEPKRFESDVVGRPYGYERVHIVDASVLPSLPATTITLSVMANAHRIAAAALN